MNWQTLREQPLDFVRPEALAACLGEGPEQWREQVLGHPRFRERLTHLMLAFHELQPLEQVPPPDAATLAVLQLPALRFARLARQCGAIWHAATLAKEVRGEVLQQLRERLGQGVYEQALAHRELAGAADLLREPNALLAAIDQDGAACLSQWLQAQPEALRAWLQLRFELPSTKPVGPAVNPAIVGVAARALLAPEEVAP